MSRELMPKSGIMMPHVVVTRDAAVVGVSTVDGQAGAVNLTDKYLQKTDAAATYQTKVEGASKDFVLDSIQPIMSGALFREDPWVVNDTPFRSTGANGVESVDMMKVTSDNSIKIGSYASSVQGVEIHSAGRLQVVDQNDSGVETKYPVYSKRYRPEIEDLPFAAIGSYVKDSKGRTVGVTRTGINSDIKQLTQKVTFTQPVTVPDAAGDYDAVTLRQLRAASGGAGGASMNGVMNNFIGAVEWFNGSRAKLPAGYIAADGQLVNRADYPDLAEAVRNGFLANVTDAEWLAGKAGIKGYNRGKYSHGDVTTTFRVPDLNGMQADSISALFLRGSRNYEVGGVSQDAAPNITGSAGSTSATFFAAAGTNIGSGALSGNTVSIGGSSVGGGQPNPLNYFTQSFDASKSSASYGRDGTQEVRPNSVVGIWIIRASGGFVAANTSWSVINGDTTAPSTGVTVNGGKVESQYKNPTSTQYASLYSSSVWGSTSAAVVESQGSDIHQFKFFENGNVDFRKAGHGNALGMYSKASIWTPLTSAGLNNLTTGGVDRVLESSVTDSVVIGYSLGAARPDGYPTKVGFHQYVPGSASFGSAVITVGGDNNIWSRYFFTIDGQIHGSSNNGDFSYTRNGVSDERVKHNIEDISPEKAINAIKGLDFKSFVYNNDEQGRVRRGVIAQQAEKVEPLYVKTRKYPGMEKGSPEIEQKELDTTPMLLDTMQVVQDLLKRIEVLESKLAEK